MEDVASGAHAALVKRDWGALQPLLHPYLHWMQADGQVVRGRTKVIGMLQAIGISGPRRPSSCSPGYRLTPQHLGDFNAVAALRIAGGHPAA